MYVKQDPTKNRKTRLMVSKPPSYVLIEFKSSNCGERLITMDKIRNNSGGLPRQEAKAAVHASVGISAIVKDTEIPLCWCFIYSPRHWDRLQRSLHGSNSFQAWFAST